MKRKIKPGPSRKKSPIEKLSKEVILDIPRLLLAFWLLEETPFLDCQVKAGVRTRGYRLLCSLPGVDENSILGIRTSDSPRVWGSLRGKSVFIMDDFIDRGRTASSVVKKCLRAGPEKIIYASFLGKKSTLDRLRSQFSKEPVAFMMYHEMEDIKFQAAQKPALAFVTSVATRGPIPFDDDHPIYSALFLRRVDIKRLLNHFQRDEGKKASYAIRKHPEEDKVIITLFPDAELLRYRCVETVVATSPKARGKTTLVEAAFIVAFQPGENDIDLDKDCPGSFLGKTCQRANRSAETCLDCAFIRQHLEFAMDIMKTQWWKDAFHDPVSESFRWRGMEQKYHKDLTEYLRAVFLV